MHINLNQMADADDPNSMHVNASFLALYSLPLVFFLPLSSRSHIFSSAKYLLKA